MSTTVCTILGAIATIAALFYLYIFVLPESKSASLSGFLKKLRSFLLFKKLYIEAVLRFLYIAATVACVCFGFFRLFGVSKGWTGTSSTFLSGLLWMIAGPIITRVVFELTMMTVLLVTNVIAINNRLGGSGTSIEIGGQSGVSDAFSKKIATAVSTAKGVADNVKAEAEAETNDDATVIVAEDDDAE